MNFIAQSIADEAVSDEPDLNELEALITHSFMNITDGLVVKVVFSMPPTEDQLLQISTFWLLVAAALGWSAEPRQYVRHRDLFTEETWDGHITMLVNRTDDGTIQQAWMKDHPASRNFVEVQQV